MMLHFFFATLPSLFLVYLFPMAIADLNADKRALLDFAAATVLHDNKKVNWNNYTSICASWIGITCSPDHTRVHAVRLPGVGLRGPIPHNTLGKLQALTTLSLRSNCLSGALPSDILSLPSLQYIYLQQNNFSGNVPSSLSSQLNVIDLSYNSFTGNIPTSIKNLTSLAGLNLQNNSLIGSIPDFNLPRLKHLNVSNNHLSGSISTSVQKFPASSFKGNLMLCGHPLDQCPSVTPSSSVPIPPPPSPSPIYNTPLSLVPHQKKDEMTVGKGTTIAILVGGSMVMLVLVLMLVLCCLKKKDTKGNGGVLKGKAFAGAKGKKSKEDYFSNGVQDAEKNKMVFFQGCSYNFDLEDLLRASAEVLGKGSYGTTYRAILEDGTPVVVKRMKEVVAGKREFEQQMEILGRIHEHPNLIPFRAYYYSKDEKLIVSDYIGLGSLSTLLHGNRESGRTLDWESRVRISLDTARGIAHIHSAGNGKLTHGNIKSSNVLLTQDIHGCISDFGLTPLMAFHRVRSSNVGYLAPEVIETKKCTKKSDVYSFGVLLLEMLTGKSPLESPGQDDVVDLPQWVQSVVREEWTAEVFDVGLMKYANIEEELVQMLHIALDCVASVPDMRPKMDEVVKMIEEIQSSDSENRRSSDDNQSRSPTTQTP